MKSFISFLCVMLSLAMTAETSLNIQLHEISSKFEMNLYDSNSYSKSNSPIRASMALYSSQLTTNQTNLQQDRQVYDLCFDIKSSTLPTFSIQQHGQEQKSKPSLAERLNGAYGITIIVPSWMRSQTDQYAFKNLQYILRNIGATNVEEVEAEYEVNYEEKQFRSGTMQYVQYLLKEGIRSITNSTKNIILVPQLVSVYPDFEGVYLDFYDLTNNWSWRVNFELPNKFNKYQKQFQQAVSKQITSSKALQERYTPISYSANWKQLDWYKSDAEENGCDEFEGVFVYDDYNCYLKKHNGKYYLVNLGNTKYPLWNGEGEIKAILTPTATPNLFTCEYFCSDKSKASGKALVIDGFLKILLDKEKIDNLTFVKTWPSHSYPAKSAKTEWGGTGFALNFGYLVTNFHVIDGAKTISIKGLNGNFNQELNATIIGTDKINDLALLKITDATFNSFGDIPYSISISTSDVGEDIFVLGYPLTSTMGEEVKLTTGVISAKSGYQGDVAQYQISAPIQPGNSGGPLFDKKGNIIGIVSAKHADAENVGYAIKSIYLHNLVESCASSSIFPSITRSSTNQPLAEQVKARKNYVLQIRCSN